VGIEVCASLGALDKEQLTALKNAGLSRYHHNIETSCRFYPHIVTTHGFDERAATIKAAKEAGLEVCSGGIIGMGETWHDRIDMALTLNELQVDSVPLNILIPIKGTPLASMERISVEDCVRTVCIFRIILRDKTIKVAAGREAVLKDEQLRAFSAGANGMIIGGYLTVKGQAIEADNALIERIREEWTR
jgi:biotin synthase